MTDAFAGGLELQLSFARDTDRTRVLESARSQGWTLPASPIILESLPSDSYWEMDIRAGTLCLPLNVVQYSSSTVHHKNCFIRYRFFDAGTFTCVYIHGVGKT